MLALSSLEQISYLSTRVWGVNSEPNSWWHHACTFWWPFFTAQNTGVLTLWSRTNMLVPTQHPGECPGLYATFIAPPTHAVLCAVLDQGAHACFTAFRAAQR